MAEFRTRRGAGAFLAGFSPLGWLLIFLVASPVLRGQWGSWTLYPGHWALSVVLLFLLAGGGWMGRGQHVPFRAGLLLGVYLALMAALREEWRVAWVAGGAVALNFFWSWAAYRVVHGRQGTGSAGDGLVLWLGVSLVVGLLGWAASHGAPGVCRFLNCPGVWRWPAPFLGGWGSQEQWLAHLLFSLPMVGAMVVMVHRSRRGGMGGVILYAILAAGWVGVAAGGKWWMVALGLVVPLLAARALGGERRGQERGLFWGVALTGVVELLLLYALAPGYLSLALGGVTGEEVRVRQMSAVADGLSSEEVAVVQVRVTSTGRGTPFAGAGAGAILRPRLLVTPPSGGTRVFDGEGVALAGPLSPHEGVNTDLPIRLPHWVKDGFLTWRVERPDGTPLPLSQDSDAGFRFSNPAYRTLKDSPENSLTALASRAREIHRTALPAGESLPDPNRAGNIVGGILDTLFFSPLWGLDPGENPGGGVFSSPRPFWAQMWRGYGALGLLLAGWLGLRLFRQAGRIARHPLNGPERLAWRLTPLTVGLLAVTGLFSPVLGSFHVLWGISILCGLVEGKHDQLFPGRSRFTALKPARPPAWPKARPRRQWGWGKKRGRY